MVEPISSGSSLGIQQLNATKKSLNKTQERITTGLRINGPKDDAATFAVAQALRGTQSGTQAVKVALNNAEATVNVAASASVQVSNLLIDLKTKALEASNPALDAASRSTINNEFQSLVDQLNTVTSSASFNGVNLVESGASSLQVLTTESGDAVTVNAQNLSAQGLGVDSLSLLTSGDTATALAAIDNAINQANSSAAQLGSDLQRIENQGEFTTRLDNVLSQGIGNLVDANLSEEAAGLTAQRVKEELGLRTLAIANAGPKALLSLF
ncbi:MAG: flagellin [Alphaproteobacteria bacterium]|nr:flagellin [Alphaproteobacteria bacterium]